MKFGVRRQEHPSAAAAPGTPLVAAFDSADKSAHSKNGELP